MAAQKREARLPISLVSPHPRGPVVTTAQKRLTANRWRDFLEGGKIDGEFGPWTARATARAKYELGFLHVTQQYGEDLDDVLAGKKPLTRARQLLRKKRLARLKKLTVGQRTWEEAGKDVANKVTEVPPFSNKNYITELYHLTGAWCAMAVSVWSHRAGSKIPIIGQGPSGRYHYCPTIMSDATEGRNGLTLVKPHNARKGDWILFDWGQDRWSDHVGLFGEWLEGGTAGRMRTREGNTSYDDSGSQSDGGAVAERTSRTLANVARNQRGDYGFVRLER